MSWENRIGEEKTEKADVQWLRNVEENKSIHLGKCGWKAMEGERYW
jgi:hypothetical protein